MKKSNIINLYKHNIVYKNIKYRQQKLFIYSLVLCAVAIFSFSYLCNVNADIGNSTQVFNPISELYRDVEVASFVDSSNINFIVPIKTDSYVVESNNIKFKVTSSIMVYAPASGIIESISNDYEKVIRIKHSNDLYSVIKNIDIAGVKVGDSVKQGKEIATAKPGENIILMIEINGKIIDGLYLNKSYIKWKTN